MSRHDEDGPVYYREIQKNAFLKRIPNDSGGSKLLPLGHKKPQLKPLWTSFCVHNGRIPYIEQYLDVESANVTHRPAWRANLKTAKYVTASVKPYVGKEHDFMIHTEVGVVRLLAADWDSMQDWVQTLRCKLHELKILPKGENVYCAAPSLPPPRAAARDPMSPLPTPPGPPSRVPGIEINPAPIRQPDPPQPDPPEPEPETQPEQEQPKQNTQTENVDLSNWHSEFRIEIPTTSQINTEPKSVAKICGQNICIDDTILKRASLCDDDSVSVVSKDDIESVADTVNSIDEKAPEEEYKQRLIVNSSKNSCEDTQESDSNEYQATNITVIEVSNKGPPHTAIPILGPETNVFNFDFKQKVAVTDTETNSQNFVNVVNTEDKNDYGTVFTTPNESEYGHISLTTTVNVTTDNQVTDVKVNDGIYEKLCMASTSKPSPLPVKKLMLEKAKKNSLPNLNLPDSNYELLSATSNENSDSVINVSSVNTSSVNGVVTSGVVNNVNLVSVCSQVRSSNLERSHSQNSYDNNQSRHVRRNNFSPRRERIEKTDQLQSKPIWKRGLTEFSLLSRLRGIGQGKRSESPTRNDHNRNEDLRNQTQIKVIHRSRPEGRMDNSRPRSNSLNNGPTESRCLLSLRSREALSLRTEQARGAAIPARLTYAPLFTEHNDSVWIAWWGAMGARVGGHTGDRLAAVRGFRPRDLNHVNHLIKTNHSHKLEILFHRVPLAQIFILNKEREDESLGMKLNSDCSISQIEVNSPAFRAGIPNQNVWAVTEVNNRPINLIKGGQEDLIRLSSCGKEVSVLIQPAVLVKKLRNTLKSNKSLINYT